MGQGNVRARVRAAIASAASVDDAALKVCLMLGTEALFQDDAPVLMALQESSALRARRKQAAAAIDIPGLADALEARNAMR